MTEVTRLPVATSAPVEQPTSSARLELSVRPDGIEAAAEGIVPPGEAPVLIRTFGAIAMGVAGITGATITLYVAPPGALAWFFSLALAELVLALVVIVLITRWERHHPGRGGRLAGPARVGLGTAGFPGQSDPLLSASQGCSGQAV